MSKFCKALFSILMSAFILTLIGPFITTGLFAIASKYCDFEIAFGIAMFSLNVAVGLLPMFGFTLLNALGSVILWFSVIGDPILVGSDILKGVLITIVPFILLLPPVIGMCLIKRAPKLFRVFVYIPLILALILKFYMCESVLCIPDLVYLMFAALLDVLVDRY